MIGFSVIQASLFQRNLRRWYGRNARALPWRMNRDPYRIWVSEIMLQQTRVAAVIPYFEKFVERFPDVESLARASEQELLTLWSGLGYYSRARNMHRTAKLIAERGSFTPEYDALRQLPGVGKYTAAAVASIAFGLPYAVLDGNARRVLSRLTCRNDGLESTAAELLDRRRPGLYNQALMELGATVCLPGEARCDICPVATHCAAKAQGRQLKFPARRKRPESIRIVMELLLVERRGRLLLRQHKGFWELPEAGKLPDAVLGEKLCQFRHSITNRSYTFHVFAATLRRTPPGLLWLPREELDGLPLSTVARKALR